MLASRLGPAGGAGAADDPAGGGAGGAGVGRAGDRRQPSIEIEPGRPRACPRPRARASRSSASEPEPLSWPSASLKSLAATAVCETSMPPSKLNLPASSGGSVGSGWPAILTRVSAKAIRLSAELDAMPTARAFGPSSLSVPLKESLPPPASSATSAAWPDAALGADRKVELERRAVDGGAARQRIGPVDRADRGAEIGLLGHHRETRLGSR